MDLKNINHPPQTQLSDQKNVGKKKGRPLRGHLSVRATWDKYGNKIHPSPIFNIYPTSIVLFLMYDSIFIVMNSVVCYQIKGKI